MAPFRNRDRSNRSGRGQVEHNVLEGLPINQYKEVEVTYEPNAAEAKQHNKDEWEPPMPRDSHLLPEHSQQILRAARSGRIYKPPAPPEEEKDGLEEEDEHKEVPQGFTVKKWVKVPRHLEAPEPEYLAKRRKGLPSQYVASTVSSQPAPLRETKVKKTDAEGNVSVYKVLVPEGQAVEGEIQATDAVIEVAPIAAVPGTVVEGVGVVNAEGVVIASEIAQQTPPRRRPPPPKKKKRHGPGRGKKKVVFVDGAPEQGTPASGAESGSLAVPNIKQQEGSVEPSEGGDTPMPDAGDEEEGSGDEGTDDEEHEEGTHSPTPGLGAPSSENPAPPTSILNGDHAKGAVEQTTAAVTAAAEPVASGATAPAPLAGIETAAPVEMEIDVVKKEKTDRDPSSSPELPLSAVSHSRQNSLNQVPTLSTVEPRTPATDLVPQSEPAQVVVAAAETVTASAPFPESSEPEPKSEPQAEPPLPPVQPEQPAPATEAVPPPASDPPSVLPVIPSVEATTDAAPAEGALAVEEPAPKVELDVLGSLERQLDKESQSMADS